MEEVRANVGAVRPDDRSQFVVNGYLSEELRIFKGSEHAAAANDPVGKVHDAASAVGERQLNAVSIEGSYVGDRCT